MAPGLFFCVSLSIDRATRIFILPSCILDMVGMEEGLAGKEPSVKSRNSPADNASFVSCTQAGCERWRGRNAWLGRRRRRFVPLCHDVTRAFRLYQFQGNTWLLAEGFFTKVTESLPNVIRWESIWIGHDNGSTWKKLLFLTRLPLKEYTGLIRKMPVSCSRFSKHVVSCCASRSRSLAYLSILSPHRSARLFCKLSILSRVENMPSSRALPCFKLRSMKKKKEKKRKEKYDTRRKDFWETKQNSSARYRRQACVCRVDEWHSNYNFCYLSIFFFNVWIERLKESFSLTKG